MAQLELTSLDFAENKQEWIKYLRNKPEFKDANFDGSNMNYLIDAFAYHTTLHANLANSAYNETTLDTVSQRKNALSIAHNLSYDEGRAIPSEAFVTVTLEDRDRVTNKIPTFDFDINTLVIPRYSLFRSSEGVEFITEQDYVLSPDNGYSLTFPIREGAILEDQSLGFSNGQSRQLFRLEEANLASILYSLKVNGVLWLNEQDITLYDPDSELYQIFENFKGTYDFVFGDNSTGAIPASNAPITLTYMTTNGSLGNNQISFSLIGSTFADGVETPANEIDNTVFNTMTLSKSTGGRDKESTEFIKRSAPRSYASQKRAVIEDDYEYSLSKHPLVEYVSVYGGETLNPPVYGFVYATIKPPGADALTPEQEDIITAYIDDFNVSSIRLRIRSPLYINVKVHVVANYDLRNTTQGTVIDALRTEIQRYFLTQGENGDGIYYSGALCSLSDIPAVKSSNMEMLTYTTVQPSVDSVYYFNLGQELLPNTIDVTFNDTSGWYDSPVDDDRGNILDKDNDTEIGTINYKTGVISVVNYDKLEMATDMYFQIASGNVELYQNILIRYDELGSTFKATGIFK